MDTAFFIYQKRIDQVFYTRMNFKIIIPSTLLALLCSATLIAQDTDHNQYEAQKMKQTAASYLERNDYSNAILFYTQAIKLAPNDISLRRDLAYTYYLYNDNAQAQKIINEVLDAGKADEHTYQIAAAIESKSGNTKKAKKLLNEGLENFPNSALLFYNRGNLAAGEQKLDDAITYWLKGIAVNPSYASNYYALAKQWEQSNPMWSLLYAETFIHLEPYTKRTAEMKSIFLKAYKNYLGQGTNTLPSLKKSKQTTISNFVQVFQQLHDNNISAISNGITTETLTMLRTRIVIDWRYHYHQTVPFTLLSYHDKLLKEGLFDVYHQWLVGAMDNSTAYSLWLKNNTALVTKFEKFIATNPLQPASYDPKP